jgi:hypothetical protein
MHSWRCAFARARSPDNSFMTSKIETRFETNLEALFGYY